MGLKHDPSQHAEYVRSWIDVLKNDHSEIFRAATQAEKIKDYVLTLELARDQQEGRAASKQPVELDSASVRFGLDRVRSYEKNDKALPIASPIVNSDAKALPAPQGSTDAPLKSTR